MADLKFIPIELAFSKNREGSTFSGWIAEDHYTGIFGAFQTEESARVAAKGRGEFGTDGVVKEVLLWRSEGRVHLLQKSFEPIKFTSAETARVQKHALSKLTDAERRALGLSGNG